MNKVIFTGRLTKDTEVRYTQENKPVANITLAVDRSYKDKNGNYPTDFFNMTAFGSTAGFLEKYGKKGVKFLVEGEVRNNNYEKDGKTVYNNQFVVNSVEFCESKKAQGDDAPTPAPTEQAPAQADAGFNEVPDASPDELPFV